MPAFGKIGHLSVAGLYKDTETDELFVVYKVISGNLTGKLVRVAGIIPELEQEHSLRSYVHEYLRLKYGDEEVSGFIEDCERKRGGSYWQAFVTEEGVDIDSLIEEYEKWLSIQ